MDEGMDERAGILKPMYFYAQRQPFAGSQGIESKEKGIRVDSQCARNLESLQIRRGGSSVPYYDWNHPVREEFCLYWRPHLIQATKCPLAVAGEAQAEIQLTWLDQWSLTSRNLSQITALLLQLDLNRRLAKNNLYYWCTDGTMYEIDQVERPVKNQIQRQG